MDEMDPMVEARGWRNEIESLVENACLSSRFFELELALSNRSHVDYKPGDERLIEKIGSFMFSREPYYGDLCRLVQAVEDVVTGVRDESVIAKFFYREVNRNPVTDDELRELRLIARGGGGGHDVPRH